MRKIIALLLAAAMAMGRPKRKPPLKKLLPKRRQPKNLLLRKPRPLR